MLADTARTDSDEDSYVRIDDKQAASANNTKAPGGIEEARKEDAKAEAPETQASKEDVAEDAYTALEDPEKQEAAAAARDDSYVKRGDEWLLFWKSLGYKIRG